MVRILLLAAVMALTCSGCGAVSGDLPDEPMSLVLDSPPAGVHAGIYLAKARAYDEAEGVRLRIRHGGDGARLVASGRADLAILPPGALARGNGLVGVMAIVQRPLDAVISGVGRPRDLEGRRVRGDATVLRSVVAGDGGDPGRLRFVSGRADATTARWDLEPNEHGFRLDDYGAPSFPGLVLAATRETVAERGPAVRAVIRALQRGYGEAQRDPASAVSTMADREPSLDPTALAAQVDAVAPAFTAGAQGVGQLRLPVLRAWAAWARRYGALERPLDVSRAFDLSLVGRPPSAD